MTLKERHSQKMQLYNRLKQRRKSEYMYKNNNIYIYIYIYIYILFRNIIKPIKSTHIVFKFYSKTNTESDNIFFLFHILCTYHNCHSEGLEK